MPCHGSSAVVQNHQTELVTVVKGVCQGRDTGVKKSGISYKGDNLVVCGYGKTCRSSHTGAHAQKIVCHLYGRQEPQGVAAYVSRIDGLFLKIQLLEGIPYSIVGFPVGAALAQDWRTKRQGGDTGKIRPFRPFQFESCCICNGALDHKRIKLIHP